jgi:hypothetical protein
LHCVEIVAFLDGFDTISAALAEGNRGFRLVAVVGSG